MTGCRDRASARAAAGHTPARPTQVRELPFTGEIRNLFETARAKDEAEQPAPKMPPAAMAGPDCTDQIVYSDDVTGENDVDIGPEDWDQWERGEGPGRQPPGRPPRAGTPGSARPPRDRKGPARVRSPVGIGRRTGGGGGPEQV